MQELSYHRQPSRFKALLLVNVGQEVDVKGELRVELLRIDVLAVEALRHTEICCLGHASSMPLTRNELREQDSAKHNHRSAQQLKCLFLVRASSTVQRRQELARGP